MAKLTAKKARILLEKVLRGATAHRWRCNSDEPDIFAEIRSFLADAEGSPPLESDKGDFAEPCADCGAPDGAGHYSCCPSLTVE